MRFILFFLPVLFWSCEGSSKAEKNVDTTSEPKVQSELIISNTNNNTGQLPSPEDIARIDDPITGGPADIKIDIEGLAPGNYKMIGFYAEGHFLADSVTVRNDGAIRIKKNEGYPQGLYYLTFGEGKYLQLILGEDQKFSATGNLANIGNSVKFSGSLENQKFYETMAFEKDFSSRHTGLVRNLEKIDKESFRYDEQITKKKNLEQERIDYLDKLFNEHPNLLFTKFKKAGQNPIVRDDVPEDQKVYYFRKEFWDNVDFSDPRLIRTPVIINKLKRYMKELTAQNQDSVYASAKMLVDKTLAYPEYFKFFANWIVIQYEPTKTTLMDPEFVFVNMARSYFTQDKAFWSDSMEVYAIQQRAHEMGQSLVGQKAQNVISTDQNGNTKELFKLTADYLIVYMYNPTCEHCMEETPKLVEWYHKNKNNNMDVFAIAIDTNDGEWKDYIKKNNMVFHNVYDPSNRSIYAKFYVDITPEIYVLNKDRTIIGKNLKVNQIDIIINRDKEKRGSN